MMKPKNNVFVRGETSWQFPLKGGPYNKLKYRMGEPLPKRLPLQLPGGTTAVYVKTEMPERKRWPIMYVYDEVLSNDPDRSSDARSRRLERIAKSIVLGPHYWWGQPRHPDPAV